MTYNTDLQSNNVELQEILNTINSLPEAGGGDSGGSSSGGGSYKTCTFYVLTGCWYNLYYTSVENGEIVHKVESATGSTGPFTVLCDSILYYDVYETSEFMSYITGGFEQLNVYGISRAYLIKAPSTEGAVGEYYEEDETIPDLDW